MDIAGYMWPPVPPPLIMTFIYCIFSLTGAKVIQIIVPAKSGTDDKQRENPVPNVSPF
jgi:hypothetical protein